MFQRERARRCAGWRKLLTGLLCSPWLLLLFGCGPAPDGAAASTATIPPAAPALATALVTYKGHAGPVIGVDWSPDGRRIATCGNDGSVQVWSAGDGQKLWQASVAQYAFAVAWSPDGRRIAGAGFDGSVVILDAASGHALATYTGQSGAIEGLAWSPDGARIASGSQDGTVVVRDARTGATLVTYARHSGGVERVAWSPDGARIASAGYDATVQVWEAASGKTLLTYKGHNAPAWEVAWSPDGTRIASGTGAAGAYGPVTAGNSVQVWDAATGKTLVTYTGTTGQTYALAWSPDGARIASGGDDNVVRVWDAASGKTLMRYTGHSDIVFKVAWSHDGSQVASASADGTAQVWRPRA